MKAYSAGAITTYDRANGLTDGPDPDPPAFLAIVGATTSGKTTLSIEVALRLGGEIVSMDSRQVYRGMDIGTAKASPGARARVRHRGLDIVEPNETYSAGRFARDARAWMDDARARGHTPLLVGGTGLFLRALTRPMFREPALDAGRRDALRRHLERMPSAKLERWVRVLDPDRAAVAAEGGPQRLSRTLEVTLLTGRPLSWWHANAGRSGEVLRAKTFLLDVPRSELDRRIDARVERMVDDGLVAEVWGLVESGVGPDAPGMTGMGYKEVLRHLRGDSTLEEAVAEIQRRTRQYARRQLTWFRNQLAGEDVIRVDGMRPLDAQVETVVHGWREALERRHGKR